MSALAQDLVVGVIALGAVVYVVRQIVGTFRPEPGDRACEHCDSVVPSPAGRPRGDAGARSEATDPHSSH